MARFAILYAFSVVEHLRTSANFIYLRIASPETARLRALWRVNTKRMSWIAQKIELVDVDRIKPYERNARTHSQHQINLLAQAIQEFGFTTPVLMKSDGTLVAGHGRLEAAKLVGLQSVPAIFVDHLSHRQLKALVLADNKIATLAGWDLAALSAELSDLSELGFDLSLTGFDEQELDALLKDDAGILPEGFNEPEKIQVREHERTVSPSPKVETEKVWFLNVQCENEQQCQELYEQFVAQGFKVKIVT